MTRKVKAFGVTRDILGKRDVELDFPGVTVGDLRAYLIQKYPQFGELNSLMIAVNSDYATDDLRLNEDDEVALIPPVSGG